VSSYRHISLSTHTSPGCCSFPTSSFPLPIVHQTSTPLHAFHLFKQMAVTADSPTTCHWHLSDPIGHVAECSRATLFVGGICQKFCWRCRVTRAVQNNGMLSLLSSPPAVANYLAVLSMTSSPFKNKVLHDRTTNRVLVSTIVFSIVVSPSSWTFLMSQLAFLARTNSLIMHPVFRNVLPPTVLDPAVTPIFTIIPIPHVVHFHFIYLPSTCHDHR